MTDEQGGSSSPTRTVGARDATSQADYPSSRRTVNRFVEGGLIHMQNICAKLWQIDYVQLAGHIGWSNTQHMATIDMTHSGAYCETAP
jgi:hypothetical protein